MLSLHRRVTEDSRVSRDTDTLKLEITSKEVEVAVMREYPKALYRRISCYTGTLRRIRAVHIVMILYSIGILCVCDKNRWQCKR
jgi:hypothetical protein